MMNQISEYQSLDTIEQTIGIEIKGKQFWGDMKIAPEEYDALKDHLRGFLQSPGGSVSQMCKRYPNCLTTFLIALVKYKYNCNFWGMVSEELSISVYGPVENKIGECARSTFVKYGFDFSDVKDERRINLEPILYEAGIPPESSLNDLFYILNYDTHTIFDPQSIVDDLVHMRSYQIRKPMLKFLKRFREDRAVEFILEVHEAMLCVDQNRSGDSHYIANYSEWKENERAKETIANRKKQEYQTKPYLSFDNGGYGLCIVLPRAIMKDEWIEEVQWHIKSEANFEVKKQVEVLGDDSQRYVDSLIVPISPAESYKIDLIDSENPETLAILSWNIPGIRKDECVFFNSNGRLINTDYLPQPYGIMICGNESGVLETTGIVVDHQFYPNSSPDYQIISVEPVIGHKSLLTYLQKGKQESLNSRPRVDITITGETLFSLPVTDDYHLFTRIPLVEIQTDEGSVVSGFELRLGSIRLCIEDFFTDGIAQISLSHFFREELSEYGTYSIRLYQGDHFIKQAEFCLLPPIETNYNPNLSWPKSLTSTQRRRLTFAKLDEWKMEFTGCTVYQSSNYTVDFSGNIGYLSLRIASTSENGKLAYSIKLPINPIECCLWDSQGQAIDEDSRRTIKLSLSKLQDDEYWVHLNSYGDFADKPYSLLLRSVNGIEQIMPIPMSLKHCGNLSINSFLDTLAKCPLPCRLELACDGDMEHAVPVLTITDSVSLKGRPSYRFDKGILITDSTSTSGVGLTLSRFGLRNDRYQFPFSRSAVKQLRMNGKTFPVRVYQSDERMMPGIYRVESSKNQGTEDLFEPEDDQEVSLTHDSETMFVSLRSHELPVLTISDWLDQLIRDILSRGPSKDLTDTASYSMIDRLQDLEKQGNRSIIRV